MLKLEVHKLRTKNLNLEVKIKRNNDSYIFF